MTQSTVELPFQSRIKSLYEAVSQEYLYLGTFNEGENLPSQINDLIGYGSYCPMRKHHSVVGEADVATAHGMALINSQLFLSLSTPYGVRFFNPEFGSKLYTLLFEPYDDFLLSRIKMYTLDAVTKDVRTITVKNIFIDSSERFSGLLKIHLEYLIVNSAISGNYTYPFVVGGEPTES
jgi:phage baseplate assembly protein W